MRLLQLMPFFSIIWMQEIDIKVEQIQEMTTEQQDQRVEDELYRIMEEMTK